MKQLRKADVLKYEIEKQNKLLKDFLWVEGKYLLMRNKIKPKHICIKKVQEVTQSLLGISVMIFSEPEYKLISQTLSFGNLPSVKNKFIQDLKFSIWDFYVFDDINKLNEGLTLLAL